MVSLKSLAINSLKWAGAQQVGMVIVNFVVGIILARLLDPSIFGVVAMITVFRNLGDSIIKSGMSSSLIRSEEIDEDDYSTVFVLNMLVSIFLYVIMYVSAPYIASFFNTPMLTPVTRTLCVTFIIRAISIVQGTKLSRDLNFKRLFIIQLPSLIVSGLLGVILAYNNYGVWSLVYMQIAQATLYSGQLIIYSRWLPKLSFNYDKFVTHFNYGYKLTLSSIISIIFENIYVVIIGKYFSATQLGFYNRANNLRQLPVNSISDLIVKVTFPLFSKIQNDTEKLKRAYRRLIQMVLFILIPLMVGLGVLAEPFFRFLLTEKWLPAVPYFQVLCFIGVLFPIISYNLNVLKVLGRSDLFLKLEIIKRVLLVIVVILSLPYGVMGLLYGQVVLNLISLFLNSYYSGALINYSLKQQLADNLKLLFVGLLFLSFMFFLYRYTSHWFSTDLMLLLVNGFAGLIVYLLVSRLFKLEQLNELLRLLKLKV